MAAFQPFTVPIMQDSDYYRPRGTDRYSTAIRILVDNFIARCDGGLVPKVCVQVLLKALQELVSTPDYMSNLLRHHTDFINELFICTLSFQSEQLLASIKTSITTCRCDMKPNNASSTFHMPELGTMTKKQGGMLFKKLTVALFDLALEFVGRMNREPPKPMGPSVNNEFRAQLQALGLGNAFEIPTANGALDFPRMLLFHSPSKWVQSCLLWLDTAQVLAPFAFVSKILQPSNPAKFPAFINAILSNHPNFPRVLFDAIKAEFVALLAKPENPSSRPMMLDKDLVSLQLIAMFIQFFIGNSHQNIDQVLPGYRARHAAHIVTTVYDMVTTLDAHASETARTATGTFMWQIIACAQDYVNLMVKGMMANEHEIFTRFRDLQQELLLELKYVNAEEQIGRIRNAVLCLNVTS